MGNGVKRIKFLWLNLEGIANFGDRLWNIGIVKWSEFLGRWREESQLSNKTSLD